METKDLAATAVTPGRMILLNGTSSSGKTSLARTLQAALLPEVWFHVDVDLLRKSHPDPTLALPYADAKGMAMETLLHAIPDCLATLLRHGINLIIDDIFGPAQLKNYVETLYPRFSPLFVGVRCDVAELDQREIARGDRPRGTARGLIKSVFTPGVFDIVVETAQSLPEALAEMVKSRLRSGESIDAFERLSRMNLAQIAEDAEVCWSETTFVNRTAGDVLIYMTDVWDGRHLRHTLPPGETHVRQMSNVHPWEVCATDGTVLAAFTTDGRDKTVELGCMQTTEARQKQLISLDSMC